jgi:hypothetical protein
MVKASLQALSSCSMMKKNQSLMVNLEKIMEGYCSKILNIFQLSSIRVNSFFKIVINLERLLSSRKMANKLKNGSIQTVKIIRQG